MIIERASCVCGLPSLPDSLVDAVLLPVVNSSRRLSGYMVTHLSRYSCSAETR